jgi:cytochrome P450
MVYNPEVQRKAQQELDEKVGRDRVPDFGDRDSLPYIDALIDELLRWFPILPLGTPHLSMIEDEYRNMRIPKESLIIPNAW